MDPVDGTNKNSLVAIGQGKGIYSKQHLVPFGEYVPFESVLRGLIGFFDLPMSRMSAGSPGQDGLTLTIKGENFDVSPAICYEIAYGESLRKRSINSSAIIMALRRLSIKMEELSINCPSSLRMSCGRR